MSGTPKGSRGGSESPLVVPQDETSPLRQEKAALQVDSLAEILHALRGIRAPIQQGEYDLHDLVRASPARTKSRSRRAAASTLCAPAASASKSSADSLTASAL